MTDKRISLRNDSSGAWTIANPTLVPGEIGVETNTGRFKIGNDSGLAWDSLGYAAEIPIYEGNAGRLSLVNSDENGIIYVKHAQPFGYKPANEPVVIVFTGQSNAVGIWPCTDSSEMPESVNVYDWRATSQLPNDSFSWQWAEPNRILSPQFNNGSPIVGMRGSYVDSPGSPLYIFSGKPVGNMAWGAANLIQKETGRDVYIICAAKSGIGIASWDSNTGTPMRDIIDSHVSLAMTSLQSTYPNIQFADIFMWMQGENDFANMSPETYKNKFIGYRKHLQDQGFLDSNLSQTVIMETYAGDYGVTGNGNYTSGYWSGWDRIIAETPENTTFVRAAGTSALPWGGWHFLGGSLNEMGVRAAKNILGISPGTKQNTLRDAEKISWIKTPATSDITNAASATAFPFKTKTKLTRKTGDSAQHLTSWANTDSVMAKLDIKGNFKAQDYLLMDSSGVVSTETSLKNHRHPYVDPFYYKPSKTTPLFIIATGQSNMLSYPDSALPNEFKPINYPDVVGNPNVYDWATDGVDSYSHAWRTINPQDSLQGDVVLSKPYVGYVRGGQAQLGYLTASRLQEATGRDVYVLNASRGGAPISEWFAGTGKMDSALYNQGIAALTALQAIDSSVEYADAFVWAQGSTDLLNGLVPEIYARALLRVRDNLSQTYRQYDKRRGLLSARHSIVVVCEPPSRPNISAQYLATKGKGWDAFGLYKNLSGSNNHVVSSENLPSASLHFTGDGIIDYSYRIANAIIHNPPNVLIPQTFIGGTQAGTYPTATWLFSRKDSVPAPGYMCYDDSVLTRSSFMRISNTVNSGTLSDLTHIRAGHVLDQYAPVFSPFWYWNVTSSPLNHGSYISIPGYATYPAGGGTPTEGQIITRIWADAAILPVDSYNSSTFGAEALAKGNDMIITGVEGYATLGVNKVGSLVHQRPYVRSGATTTNNGTTVLALARTSFPEDSANKGSYYMLSAEVSGRRTGIAITTTDHVCYSEDIAFARSLSTGSVTILPSGTGFNKYRYGNTTPLVTFGGTTSQYFFFLRIRGVGSENWQWSGRLKVTPLKDLPAFIT